MGWSQSERLEDTLYIPLDDPAIRYDQDPSDPVAQLEKRIEAGEVKLDYTSNGQGYLPSVLRNLGINADVAPIVVDDPYAIQSGDTIVVTRQLRGDPLARLHSHRQIDDAQYYAGRAYQRDCEVAERATRALDPTREAVDNSLVIDPLTDKQVSAQARLADVRIALGQKMHAAVHAVLIDGAHNLTTIELDPR